MKKQNNFPALPYYIVAVLWLSQANHLYLLSDYLQLSAVSLAILLLFRLGAKLSRNTPEEPAAPNVDYVQPTEQKKDAAPKTTGDAALDKMQSDGALAISELERLGNSISDVGVSADILRLQAVTQGILDHVGEHPEKLPQIRKFMDYYLPTTLKLLNTYDRMSAAGVDGENISSGMERISGILRTLVAAFEKQLDGLFGAEAMDITTDIDVLETMLAREGLTGQILKAETIQNLDDMDRKHNE